MISSLLGYRVRALIAVQIGTKRYDEPLTWAQLAKRADIHPAQVEQIETGKRDPYFTTVFKIAKALGLNALDELLAPLPLACITQDGQPTQFEKPSLSSPA